MEQLFTISDDPIVAAGRGGEGLHNDECEVVIWEPEDTLHLRGSVDAVRRFFFRAMSELERTADSWVDVQIDETATE